MNKEVFNEVLWPMFLRRYLDESRPPVTLCYRWLCEWAKQDMPQLLPLPAVDIFYRAVHKIPNPVLLYYRNGKKKYESESRIWAQQFQGVVIGQPPAKMQGERKENNREAADTAIYEGTRIVSIRNSQAIRH